MRDLKSRPAIVFKGLLFLLLGVASSALLLAEAPTARAALFLAVAAWAFCRAYYFAFYVIERYLDPAFRFSGLLSALRYLLSNRRGSTGPESRR